MCQVHTNNDGLAMQETSDDKKEQHWLESENCRIDVMGLETRTRDCIKDHDYNT